MKIGLIIIEPLQMMTKDFLIELTTKDNPYHMCFVRDKNNSRELFSYLEKKAKAKNMDMSVIYNMNKNLSPVKAAYRYLKSRTDIEDIILLENRTPILIKDYECFYKEIEKL